ncbi:HAD-IIB family hydrolase [Micromonospora sp. DR5-3]|uniref:HAD-IIB family hydrolase n=1 Tax=unclassified Micromonospora TaxID=2617518 RepID=UPI0011D5BCDD|nr:MULTISPECIES: HAD-IIB family hydrolase [unclassified Micromonospora]MCW3816213.1 HAD-IIB family hydrolase [Micromonospora sp. DR5-3]TYC23967.1 HAD-IIB family hydrolase [Micromonospora sp. MP36]
MNDLRVVAFDLDDTLAVSKSQIDRRMAELLGHLLTEVDVLIISGGRFEQFEAQVLAHLELTEEQLVRLHLMPTCGTRYYRWQDGDWRLVYAEDLSEADKARIVAALTESAQALGLWEDRTWGDIIEDRGSQITFSALGQSAPPAEKYGWDPDGSKKKRLRDAVAEQLPDLEVRGGGSTSIDVTRKGVDKAYGMRKLLECLDLKHDNVLFVGDRLDHGGNDYPVKAMGIQCHAVTCWQETADYVQVLVDDLVRRHAQRA